MTFRGVISKGQVVLDDANSLPEGTIVEVKPLGSADDWGVALKDISGLWQDRGELGQDGAEGSLKLRRAVERGDARL